MGGKGARVARVRGWRGSVGGEGAWVGKVGRWERVWVRKARKGVYPC